MCFSWNPSYDPYQTSISGFERVTYFSCTNEGVGQVSSAVARIYQELCAKLQGMPGST